MTRVLLVDDEPGLLVTTAANLELEGLEVVTALNAAEALAALARERFDVVISDIRMPGMSGIDLYHEVQRRHPGLPMLLNTGFFDERQVAAALGEGVFV